MKFVSYCFWRHWRSPLLLHNMWAGTLPSSVSEDLLKSFSGSTLSVRILAGNRWCTHAGKSFIKGLFTKVCVQDLGKGTGMLQCPSGDPLPKLSWRGRWCLPEPRVLETDAGQELWLLVEGCNQPTENYQEEILEKNFLTSLCSLPLISYRDSPLAEPMWKPEGKGDLEAVHIGWLPGQRADGDGKRVELSRQKVLSTDMQPSKYVNQ